MENTTDNSSARAAGSLAYGRRTRNLLGIGLACSVAANVAIPVWDGYQDAHRQPVVILDTTSGQMLVSPIVDPANSNEIITHACLWSAQCLLDRSAVGFRHPELLKIMFNPDAAKAAREEWDKVATEYKDKHLESTVDVEHIGIQGIAHGLVSTRLECKVTLSGIVNGEATREEKHLAVNFQLAQNTDLLRRHRYPLMVVSFSYPDTKKVATK
jgi:hypothetical protein